MNLGVALVHCGPFFERAWAEWNRQMGWGWRPRLLVGMFAVVSMGGFLLMSLFRQEPAVLDLIRVGLFLAFVAHGWGVGGVARVVAAEMEAGTLELLLLTRIRPRDLVLGQYGVAMAGSVVAVMGLVPWLAVGWMNAGWEIRSAGWLVAVWWVSGLALSSVALVIASYGRTLSSGGMSAVAIGFLLTTTQVVVSGWVNAPNRLDRETGARNALVWLGVIAGGGGLWSWWRLTRKVRGGGWGAWASARRWWGVPRRPGAERRRRLLAGNPIEWLAAAGCPWWAWLMVAAGVLWPWWQGTWTGPEAFRSMGWVRGGLLILLSFQAYGQMRYDLKEGTWEALLRTPVTPGQYVMGNLRAWWRQQMPILGCVAVIPVMVTVSPWDQGTSWREVWGLLQAGLLLTAADAVLASVWFLGSAVKYDGASFLFAAGLSAGILCLMQVLHREVGMGVWWPWIWMALAGVVFWLSHVVVCREITDQLAEAAGQARRRAPGWSWSWIWEE